MQPPKTGFSKKKSTILPTKYSAFFGGEYRDRTGDLLHAMQALSRTTRLHTPHKAVGIDDDLRCNGKKPRLQKMYGKTFTACINIYTDINNKQPMETMSCLLPIEMFQQMMMKEKK